MPATLAKNIEGRPLRVTHALALLAGAAGVLVPACANPDAIAPIARQHAITLEALAAHAEASRVLLSQQVEAGLEIRRVTLAGRLHRELLRSGVMSPDFEAMPGRLEEQLGDAASGGALVEEIRSGRMTLEAAQAWLIDYALACKMSEGAAARRALLAKLAPVERFEAGAASLRTALATHGDAIASLIDELRSDARAIEFYARRDELPATWDRAKTRELIEQFVLTRIEQDERREAAAELLDLLLEPWPQPALAEGGGS